METKGLKAAFYGRHSTDAQTIDTQRHLANEFAKKYNMIIIEEYIDENVSAFKKMLDKRLELDRLRKDARLGKFDCVLVYKSDRLARKTDQHMQLWGEFRELNIPIILTQSEKLYTTDSPTEIMVEIGLSSFESENTRIRTRDNYNYHTEQGKWLGGTLPYGYRYDMDDHGNSIIVQIPKQIENIEVIYDYYKRGYGFKRIANMMNDQHPKDVDNEYSKWVAESIKSIITNPFYAGFTTSQRIIHGTGNSINDRSEWKKGKCEKIPAAISEAEWEVCMDLYEKKKKGTIHQNKFITPYLFRDILFCKLCDEKLSARNYASGKKKKDGKPYSGRVYVCQSCKQNWSAERIDDALLEQVLSGWHYQYLTKSTDTIQKRIMEDVNKDIKEIEKYLNMYQKEKNSLIGKLSEVEDRQKILMRNNPEPDDLQLALVQYRISIQKKINQIMTEIEEKRKKKEQLLLAYGDIDNFKSYLESVTGFKYDLKAPEFRKLLLYLFDKITVTGKKGDYRYELIAKVDLDERGQINLGFN